MQRGVLMKLSIKRSFLFLVIALCGGNIVASQPKVIVPTVSTLQEALFNVRKVIINFPAHDDALAQAYEKNKAAILAQCAKVLYDNAREQILQALQEIDNRIAYWRGQKAYQWYYSLTNNIIQWVTNKNQSIGIDDKIEQLQSHQGELYALLGQLAEHGTIYDREYKTIFTTDSLKAYAWIDQLLTLLARIKVTVQNSENMPPFITRVTLLKLKLTKVRSFKNDILAEMPEAQIPAHFVRNWLKYGALALGLGLGYKYITFEQLKKSYESVMENVFDPITAPVKRSAYVLFPELREKPQDVNLILPSLSKTQNVSMELAQQFVIDTSKKYRIENVTDVINGMNKGDYTAFQKFLAEIGKKEKLDASKISIYRPTKSTQNIIEWAASQSDYIHGLIYLVQLLGLSSTVDFDKFIVDLIEAQKRDFKGVRDLLLLTPAALISLLTYAGYRKFRAQDYTPIRRALIDINSLFVDQTKPLDDERYGKMIYLVYNLKKQAEKIVPVADRNDFIEDLNKIESKEFDVAAKRRIIDDMFRKYSFLKMS